MVKIKFDTNKKELIKELEKKVRDFENPYPKDIFVWDNKEKLEFDRGRFNEFIYNVVENIRNKIIEIICEDD